jgi:hypothetical protein
MSDDSTLKLHDACSAAPMGVVAMMRPVSPGRDRIFAIPGAGNWPVEYSDFGCRCCKRRHETVKQVVQDYE